MTCIEYTAWFCSAPGGYSVRSVQFDVEDCPVFRHLQQRDVELRWRRRLRVSKVDCVDFSVYFLFCSKSN
jgi:hypothetical protein